MWTLRLLWSAQISPFAQHGQAGQFQEDSRHVTKNAPPPAPALLSVRVSWDALKVPLCTYMPPPELTRDGAVLLVNLSNRINSSQRSGCGSSQSTAFDRADVHHRAAVASSNARDVCGAQGARVKAERRHAAPSLRRSVAHKGAVRHLH
jgi:hypothetical protein